MRNRHDLLQRSLRSLQRDDVPERLLRLGRLRAANRAVDRPVWERRRGVRHLPCAAERYRDVQWRLRDPVQHRLHRVPGVMRRVHAGGGVQPELLPVGHDDLHGGLAADLHPERQYQRGQALRLWQHLLRRGMPRVQRDDVPKRVLRREWLRDERPVRVRVRNWDRRRGVPHVSRARRQRHRAVSVEQLFE